MLDNSVLAGEVLRHGAYLCLRRPHDIDVRALAGVAIVALAEKLGLENEFEPAAGPPARSIAFLRRHGATPGAIADDDLLHADAVVHVAAPKAQPVEDFCGKAARQLGHLVRVRILSGVVRPRTYTGAAMNNFAYAHQVVQRSGKLMPNAFLVPMSKTAEWWKKNWMERHTYFLPRYDDSGRMTSEGHALAAEAGIACLLRRTYKSVSEQASQGEYDFITYFECADADIPVFQGVCAALRDVRRNPEWRFVREGPSWHGRRVASWDALFTPAAP